VFITNTRHQLSIASVAPNLFLPTAISVKVSYSSNTVKNSSITIDSKYFFLFYMGEMWVEITQSV
jgi:hypothetical protein